jgi:hypothetical protein
MTSQRAKAFSKEIMVQQQDSVRWNKSAATIAGGVKRFGEGGLWASRCDCCLLNFYECRYLKPLRTLGSKRPRGRL